MESPRETLTREEAAAWLDALGHPRPERWLAHLAEEGRLAPRGDPPRYDREAVLRELIRDECDKLYNQAWCAADQIRNAEDPESVLMLVVNDLPAAVEQAFSLEPKFAVEHLTLFREQNEERCDMLLRELGAGTELEAAGRIECLAFWEENAEDASPLRLSLFRLVRRRLGGEDAA